MVSVFSVNNYFSKENILRISNKTIFWKLSQPYWNLYKKLQGQFPFLSPMGVPHFYRKKNKENIGRWHLAGISGSSIKRRDFLQRTTHFFVKQKISCLNSFWSDPEGDKFLGAIPHWALRHLQSNSKFYPHRDSSHDIGFSRFPLINFWIMMDSSKGWFLQLLPWAWN